MRAEVARRESRPAPAADRRLTLLLALGLRPLLELLEQVLRLLGAALVLCDLRVRLAWVLGGNSSSASRLRSASISSSVSCSSVMSGR